MAIKTHITVEDLDNSPDIVSLLNPSTGEVEIFVDTSLTLLGGKGINIDPNPLGGDQEISVEVDDSVISSFESFLTNGSSNNIAVYDAPSNDIIAGVHDNGAITIGERTGTVGVRSVVLGSALGSGSEASGQYSFALGDRVEATGSGCFAIGSETVSSFNNSFAGGDRSEATGSVSFAFGGGAVASGNNSVSFSGTSTAQGSFSTYRSAANSTYSFATGIENIQNTMSGAVVGSFNEDYLSSPTTSPFNSISDDSRIFQVGIGDGPEENEFEFVDGLGRADGLYVTYRNGTVIRNGLTVEIFEKNPSTGEYIVNPSTGEVETTVIFEVTENGVNGESLSVNTADVESNFILQDVSTGDLITLDGTNSVGKYEGNGSFTIGKRTGSVGSNTYSIGSAPSGIAGENEATLTASYVFGAGNIITGFSGNSNVSIGLNNTTNAGAQTLVVGYNNEIQNLSNSAVIGTNVSASGGFGDNNRFGFGRDLTINSNRSMALGNDLTVNGGDNEFNFIVGERNQRTEAFVVGADNDFLDDMLVLQAGGNNTRLFMVKNIMLDPSVDLVDLFGFIGVADGNILTGNDDAIYDFSDEAVFDNIFWGENEIDGSGLGDLKFNDSFIYRSIITGNDVGITFNNAFTFDSQITDNRTGGSSISATNSFVVGGNITIGDSDSGFYDTGGPDVSNYSISGLFLFGDKDFLIYRSDPTTPQTLREGSMVLVGGSEPFVAGQENIVMSGGTVGSVVGSTENIVQNSIAINGAVIEGAETPNQTTNVVGIGEVTIRASTSSAIAIGKNVIADLDDSLVLGSDEGVRIDASTQNTNANLLTVREYNASLGEANDNVFAITHAGETEVKRITISSSTDTSITPAAVYTVDSTGGSVTLTLQSEDAVNGRTYYVKRQGTNAVTIATEGSETVEGSATSTIAADGNAVTLIYNSDTTDWEIF